jgi:hypothetical protein
MKRKFVIVLVLIGAVSIFAGCDNRQAGEQKQPGAAAQPSPQTTAGNETADAKEAFKKCVAAYNAGNKEEAKRYMAKATLAEMEQSGQLDMAMGMMAGLNIDEFTPLQEGNRITFKKSEKQGDMSMSMSVTMVKEEGQWKFGK